MNLFRQTLRTLPAFLLLQATLSAANLQLVESREVFLFAGQPGQVRVTVANQGQEDIRGPLSYRLFQASSATMAPAGEQKETQSLTFPGGQTVLVEIPVIPPQTRTITSYVLKLYQDGDPFGTVRFRSCPPQLLRGLQRLSDPIALFEPEISWAAIFQEQELPLVTVQTEFRSFEGKLLIVRLASRQSEREWNDALTDLPPQLALLLVVSSDVTGAEILAPIKFTQKAGRPTAVVQDWFLPDLATSPLSQLRLLRAAELLLDSAQ